MCFPAILALLLIAVGKGHGATPVQNGAPGVNLIPNPSVEIPDGTGTAPKSWCRLHWGDSDDQFTYLDTGYSGQHSVHVDVSNYTYGGAGWTFSPVKVAPGQTYEYSDYYQASVPSVVTISESELDGTQHVLTLFQAPPSQEWRRFSGTFTADANAASVSVCHELHSNGTLTTDVFALVATKSKFVRPLISLTFDDSYQNFYDVALPLLQQQGVAATQYVISGLLAHPGYLTVPEVLSLHADGVEIGAHTVTHRDLTTLSQSDLETELASCQSTLYGDIAVPIPDLASPFGAFNDQVLASIRTHYRSHRTTQEGFNDKVGFDPYRIRSMVVSNHTTLAQIQQWVNTCAISGTWLVIVHHFVDSTGVAGSITPALFANELGVIQQSGIHTCTVNDAINELTSQ